MTVSELLQRMTPEEMVLWSGFYAHEHKVTVEQQRKAQRRRR